MSTGPRDIEVLAQGARAGTGAGIRRLVAGGLLLNLLLVWVVGLFAPGPCAYISWNRCAFCALWIHPLWFWLPAGLLTWLVWSILGGAVQRAVILDAAGLPVDRRAVLGHAIRRAPTHFGSPIYLLLAAAVLLAVGSGIVQVVRIPYAGWPLLVLLFPVVLVVGKAGLSLVVRWVLAGHLAGPGIAQGNADAFRALSRAFAYHRGAPWRSLGLRGLGFVTWLYRSLLGVGLTVGVILLAWLVLRERAAEAPGLSGLQFHIARGAIVALAILLGAWVGAVVLGAFFGVRAGVYLVLRRELDGTPVDTRGSTLEPEPTLEELGLELVQSLRREADVGLRREADVGLRREADPGLRREADVGPRREADVGPRREAEEE